MQGKGQGRSARRGLVVYGHEEEHAQPVAEDDAEVGYQPRLDVALGDGHRVRHQDSFNSVASREVHQDVH
eukprot:14941702-Heterocapsa_arctica.AAC.1